MTKIIGGSAPQAPDAAPPAAEALREREGVAPAAAKEVQARDHYAGKGAVQRLEAEPVAWLRGLEVLALQDSRAPIASTFPLDDLSKIVTHGRMPAAFRLDSNSVRMMWMTARRIQTPLGVPGYEINFWLQGSALKILKNRLEAKGAEVGRFTFNAAEPVVGEDGRSTLKQSAKTWKIDAWDSEAKALFLDEPEKFDLAFNFGEPKTLEGAVRLRVFGDDATATKNLQEVVRKLGLQSMFAPPTPKSLERFKLARLTWQNAPDRIDLQRRRGLNDLSEEALRFALSRGGHTAENLPVLKAIDSAALDSPEKMRIAKLALTMLDRQPFSFLEWARLTASSHEGILPGHAPHGGIL